MSKIVYLLILTLLISACGHKPDYDVIIRNGLVYDGGGGPAIRADIGLRHDTIAFMGDLSQSAALKTVDARGFVVCPGFINVLSWAHPSLIKDGRSLSDLMQGVTTEIMGEGESEGPLTDKMQRDEEEGEGDIKYSVSWSSVNEYLLYLQRKGISVNVGSFAGATTIRENVIGQTNRAPSPIELKKMDSLLAKAMREGAFGLSSALIYVPGTYAGTDELISLAKVASVYHGIYISHIRGEGDQLLTAANELIKIAHDAQIPGMFYHLKASGRQNWEKLDLLKKKIDSARNQGLKISACMYTYTAGATGLNASMPPDVQEGGLDSLITRLQIPATRREIIQRMDHPGKGWENLFFAAGPQNIICTGFQQDSLKYLTGKTLAEIAKIYRESPAEAAVDLIIRDRSRIEAIYFLMDEANLRKEIRMPFMSFCSDAPSLAPEGDFLGSHVHPRAYGNFARLLAKYVREEKVISLGEAIHRLSGLPAAQLKLKKRGILAPGNYGDIVIFDPAKIQDHATYRDPHQLATGIIDIFVNGVQVIKNGRHTLAMPGRAVFGPGYQKQ